MKPMIGTIGAVGFAVIAALTVSPPAHADPVNTCRYTGNGWFDNTGTPCRGEDLRTKMGAGTGGLFCWTYPEDPVCKQ